MRLDIVFEGRTIVGIHNSNFKDIVADIDWLCGKLQEYKGEMTLAYGVSEKPTSSRFLTHIYLMRNANGHVKIGRSYNPAKREKTLHSENPLWKMIFISQITDINVEKELHKKFNHKRLRGEWFALNDEDIDYIKRFDYVTT